MFDTNAVIHAEHGLLGPELPSVSILICTRNRAASLSRTLDAMLRLDIAGLAAVELVVVDNGSTDDTRAVVLEAQNRAPFQVMYVLETRAGLGGARNTAINRSTHPVILATDDDCMPATDWLLTAARLFSSDLMKLVGGRVELSNPEHLPLSIKTSLARERLTSSMNMFGFLHGANMAFGRPVVERIGGFDARFGAGTPLQAAEDCEFVYRAVLTGIPVTYEPDLVVSHDHGRSGDREWYRQNRAYSVGAGAMAMKHLLHGRSDVLRMTYWDVRATIRAWRNDSDQRRMLQAKFGLLVGAARFLLQSSWRRSA